MKIFEGKSPTERNKIIAAGVLGAMALIALSYTFGGMFFGSKKPAVSVSVKTTPTPATSAASGNQQNSSMPSKAEENFLYTTTPVVYNPNSFYAPDAGRNIFAFYEPPVPTPYVPTPTPIAPYVEPPTPTPTPIPPLLVDFVTPQSVYSGSKTFRLEVLGSKFTPDSVIIYNGSELPTTYVSPQKLVAEIPANLIGEAGQKFIMVRTPDGRLYSNQIALNVQAPPQPQFEYIGLIARKRYNNDTAYFQEQGKQLPTTARLNDIVNGRFRLISISPEETIFEDVNLGFKYKRPLYRPEPGQDASNGNQGAPANNFPNNGGRRNTTNNIYNNNPNGNPPIPTYIPPQGEIPGIPNSIPRYNPTPQQTPPPQPKNDDVDDDGDN